MLECPHCYRIFRISPEQIGARCPKCRMPLFERPPKRRPVDKDLGPCPRHPQSPSVAKCVRCDRLVCAVCRTRWHDEATCPECVEKSVRSGEPTPHETGRQQRLAWSGLILAAAGWFIALLIFWPLAVLHAGGGGGWIPWAYLGTSFFFVSFVPALIALGQSTAALRLRGPLKSVAACGLVTSALQLGVLIGVVVMNLWHN